MFSYVFRSFYSDNEIAATSVKVNLLCYGNLMQPLQFINVKAKSVERDRYKLIAVVQFPPLSFLFIMSVPASERPATHIWYSDYYRRNVTSNIRKPKNIKIQLRGLAFMPAMFSKNNMTKKSKSTRKRLRSLVTQEVNISRPREDKSFTPTCNATRNLHQGSTSRNVHVYW